jgi:uncharacterized repeat protein (TIGR01451 family)
LSTPLARFIFVPTKTKHAMKKIVLLSALVLTMFGLTTNLKAQTVVVLQYAADSTFGTLCPPPVSVGFGIYGGASGYNPAIDSMDIYVNFGDGNDTLFTTPIFGSPQSWFSVWFGHVYTTSGIFSVQYIATAPDGNADTVTTISEVIVGNSCGNINGILYNDANSNCVYNAGIDSLIRGAAIILKYNGSPVGYCWSDLNGVYSFSAPTNFSYTVELQANNYGLLPSCPSSGIIAVNPQVNPVNDFGLICSTQQDFVANGWGWGFTPGFNSGVVQVNVGNASCMPAGGTLTLTLDPMTTYISSIVTPTSVNGQVITWNFPPLSNQYYYWFWSYFWSTVTVGTSVNAQIGDTLCFQAVVTPLSGDLNPANNTTNFCQTVRSSWDPNSKEVNPLGIGNTGRVAPNTNFKYTLNFQNMGNDTAHNVAILDTLDADLDVSTLQLVGSSHVMHIEYQGNNVVKFIFPNIMLPDSGVNEPASHGWVTYGISAKPGLQNGTQINNTGYIYFDFNPAVVTNTTLNTIDIALGVSELADDNMFDVYPNPASQEINITLPGMVNGNVKLVDVLGKVVFNEQLNGDHKTIDLSDLAPGIYNIVVTTGEKTGVRRVVITR